MPATPSFTGGPTIRERGLEELDRRVDPWDLIIIGGGATGLGAAVDAATRGLSTLLLERSDIAKGTSSRSTKLVHGGVRYLEQGDISLVWEALHERGRLRANAPHVVTDEIFIIPVYAWWRKLYYGVGLRIYDRLAGRLGLGRSRMISRGETLRRLPGLRERIDGIGSALSGGVLYHDGEFDDARLAVDLARTAVRHGAVVLNYMNVTGLLHDGGGRVCGVTAIRNLQDEQEGEVAAATPIKPVPIHARVVVNATGVFADEILRFDHPRHEPMIRPSQGVHLVVDRSFFPGEDALVIPRTSDGRILFAVPWQGSVILGTTDTLVKATDVEPRAQPQEIEFILATAAGYLSRPPSWGDIRSVFAGLRPLAAPKRGSARTGDISRRHRIEASPSGLLTIIGGKWTTYRRMGEDLIDRVLEIGRFPVRACRTATMPILPPDKAALAAIEAENPDLAMPLDPRFSLTGSQVVRAVRHEFAMQVEDVLARRSRVLFHDARAAIDLAPDVARLMAIELGRSQAWIESQVRLFSALAAGYLPPQE